VEHGISNPIWITVLCIAAALGVSLTELTIAIEDEENHALTPSSHLGPVRYVAGALVGRLGVIAVDGDQSPHRLDCSERPSAGKEP
jgi:hypothetical protein